MVLSDIFRSFGIRFFGVPTTWVQSRRSVFAPCRLRFADQKTLVANLSRIVDVCVDMGKLDDACSYCKQAVAAAELINDQTSLNRLRQRMTEISSKR